jgi:hypothetical protein
MSASHDPTPRYRFGPLEQHGFLMGLRGGQVAVLGGGLLTAFGILVGTQQPVPVVAAGVAALAVAFVPLGGRTLEQWAPVALRYAARRALGRHLWTSPAPLRGHRLRRRGRQAAVVEAPVALPPSLRGLAILTVTDRALLPAGLPAGIGIIRDRAAGTWAAVLRAQGSTFALRDDGEQHHLVGGWAEVLAGMADNVSPVSRLQVLERTLPDTGEDAARYLAVSAASVYDLELACKEVQRQASRARLQLVRLAGEQAAAVTAVLPLRRGLR